MIAWSWPHLFDGRFCLFAIVAQFIMEYSVLYMWTSIQEPSSTLLNFGAYVITMQATKEGIIIALGWHSKMIMQACMKESSQHWVDIETKVCRPSSDSLG